MLTIQRQDLRTDRLRKYNILIDGKVVGQIKNDQKQSFQLAKGRHDLQLKVDWCSSPRVTFQVEEGLDNLYVCGTSVTGAKFFLFILYLSIMSNKYLFLRETTDLWP